MDDEFPDDEESGPEQVSTPHPSDAVPGDDPDQEDGATPGNGPDQAEDTVPSAEPAQAREAAPGDDPERSKDASPDDAPEHVEHDPSALFPPDHVDPFETGPDGGASTEPWPPRDDPAVDAPAAHVTGIDMPETTPPPTRAEWRQLASEVRRLAAQVAHGRA